MDATPQTVAQAVAAATQAQQAQQQQQQHTPQPQAVSPAVQAPQSTPSSTVDNLTCQWQGCGERTDSAESLYDHVCERHVGRKSTNNLNLTCQWGACRTTTVKRDHITSHIRVHVPLKPHKCDFCGKAFKRPQDLKKHVKTHADDSVLTNSPHQSTAGRASLGASAGVNGEDFYALSRHLSDAKIARTGYYAGAHDSGLSAYPSYQPAIGAGAAGYAAAAAGAHYAGYGSVSYPNSSAMADIQSLDTRRRAIEALNDFLGDIKRRAINPQTYYDVGHRLQGNSLPLPVSNGYNTGYSNPSSGSYGGLSAASLLDSFNNSTEHMGGVHGGVASHQGYSLPLPNARTKSDLQDIDKFLEQLQATVYETSTQAAAAGVQQAGVHAQYPGDYGFGQSHNPHRPSNNHSPPSFTSLSSSGSSQNVSGFIPLNSSSNNNNSLSPSDTSASTPASMSSYTSSSYSPLSTHSRTSMSSLSGNMYPSLPSVAGLSDGSSYPITTSAPASSLASGFDGLDVRRMSGGKLQREAPPQEDVEMRDADDGSRTPRASEAQGKEAKVNSIDPALREEAASAASPAACSETEDKRQEDWVENIRTIEALRKWVSDRLEAGQYEDESASQTPKKEHEGVESQESTDAAAAKMAETAKMVEERMAKALAEDKAADEAKEVKYPSLPTEA